jgi:hypothetical protein
LNRYKIEQQLNQLYQKSKQLQESINNTSKVYLPSQSDSSSATTTNISSDSAEINQTKIQLHSDKVDSSIMSLHGKYQDSIAKYCSRLVFST